MCWQKHNDIYDNKLPHTRLAVNTVLQEKLYPLTDGSNFHILTDLQNSLTFIAESVLNFPQNVYWVAQNKLTLN